MSELQIEHVFTAQLDHLKVSYDTSERELTIWNEEGVYKEVLMTTAISVDELSNLADCLQRIGEALERR